VQFRHTIKQSALPKEKEAELIVKEDLLQKTGFKVMVKFAAILPDSIFFNWLPTHPTFMIINLDDVDKDADRLSPDNLKGSHTPHSKSQEVFP